MSDERPTGSYTYPNTSADPDRQNVLRNKFGIRSKSELRQEEYAATALRINEILQGHGPEGNFDAAHLKAIHGYIFQDVYEWAGHSRNETPMVDGAKVEPIGGLSKGETSFLHGSRIEMGLREALKPISDPKFLRNASREEFVDRVAKALAEMNYVHPFREGNGRTQETFIVELGRRYGHDIDLNVITKTRMIEASIATTNDPSSPALKHVIADAIDPNRREALLGALKDLTDVGEQTFEHYVRTAHPGELIEGQVFGHTDRVATLVTEKGIIAVDRADLPATMPSEDDEVKFTARSDFTTLGMGQPARTAGLGHAVPDLVTSLATMRDLSRQAFTSLGWLDQNNRFTEASGLTRQQQDGLSAASRAIGRIADAEGLPADAGSRMDALSASDRQGLDLMRSVSRDAFSALGWLDQNHRFTEKAGLTRQQQDQLSFASKSLGQLPETGNDPTFDRSTGGQPTEGYQAGYDAGLSGP